MKTQIIFKCNLGEFVSKITEEAETIEIKNAIYESITEMNKFELEMEDGFVVFGEQMVKNGCFIIKEIKG